MSLADLLTASYLTVFLKGWIVAAMPLLLAATGETLSEQSGVLNLGIEGQMLVAGLAGYVATLASGSLWLGFAVAALVGLGMGLFMAVACCWFGLNQIVIGLALTVGGTGLTDVLFELWFSGANPRVPAAPSLSLGALEQIPVLGPGLFAQPLLFWAMLGLCVVCGPLLRHTQWGLRVRAAGQRPDALDRAGGSVMRTRTVAVMLGGLFAGLGGAYLALLGTGAFTKGLVGGMGFIAIILAMLSHGRIWLIVLIAAIYGLAVAMGTSLQLLSSSLSSEVVHMLPAAVMMLVLVLFARSVYIPPALAIPYHRGDR